MEKQMSKDSKINYEKRPVPTSPGAMQITNEGLMNRKGSAPMVSEMPKKNVVPGPDKKTSSR
jgi:hypothetical protein